jgi:hypothetical protein
MTMHAPNKPANWIAQDTLPDKRLLLVLNLINASTDRFARYH